MQDINLSLNTGINKKSSTGILKVLRDQINLYSDPYAVDLKQGISDYHNTPPENIFIGWGVGNCLIETYDTLFETCTPPCVLTNELTYFPFRQYCKSKGAKVVDWCLDKDKCLDLDVLPNCIEEHSANAVYIVNPNNPTGILFSQRDALLSIIKQYPDTWFLIDEAYIDYCENIDNYSFVNNIKENPNVLVFRTFSKAHSLAGVKLGYVLAASNVIEKYQCARVPYRISNLQVTLGLQALADTQHIFLARETNRKQIAALTETVNALYSDYIFVYESNANFIFAQSTNGTALAPLTEKIRKDGFVLKIFTYFPDCIRISTTDKLDFDKFLTYLKTNQTELTKYMAKQL